MVANAVSRYHVCLFAPTPLGRGSFRQSKLPKGWRSGPANRSLCLSAVRTRMSLNKGCLNDQTVLPTLVIDNHLPCLWQSGPHTWIRPPPMKCAAWSIDPLILAMTMQWRFHMVSAHPATGSNINFRNNAHQCTASSMHIIFELESWFVVKLDMDIGAKYGHCWFYRTISALADL